MRIIADIEADNLLDDVTKIHCMCYYNIDTNKSVSLTTYEQIVELLATPNLTIVGHYFVLYDMPVLRKILKIESKPRIIDTIPLSWYLYPSRLKHGLAEWGEDLGVAKPPIENWSGETQEERDKILHRCQEDVKINTKLFFMMLEYLKKIYNNNMTNIGRLMDYLSFKMDCAREQEEVKFRLDVPKATENLAFLEGEKKKKIDILSEIMPPSHTYKIKAKPKALFKADGSISSHGQKWFDLLKSQELPEHHNMSLKLVDKTNKGNPGSHQQLKDWLFKLGWKPTTFKYVKEDAKDGETYTPMNKQTTRAVPQLSADDGSGICTSVKELYEVHPELVELEDMFIINHRISILKGFLEKVDSNGFLKAEIAGLTNTLRFQHSKPLVNLPTIPKKYWEMIRGCLIAPDNNHILCGSDMSSLESNTRNHFMYFFDPTYVQELNTKGFDSHTDIAVQAKMITKEEENFYKNYSTILEPTKDQKELYSKIKGIRLKAKKVNFACLYGAGIPKLILTGNLSKTEATLLFNTYWKRNKAVKLVAENAIRKTIDNSMWLYNPVSRFWYSLRFEKDSFSTINQSCGVYCFDTWIKHIREQDIKISMQYHDECVIPVAKGLEQQIKDKLNKAIKQTNDEIKLNVPLGISIEFGQSYASIH